MPTIDINLREFEKLVGAAYAGNMGRLDEDLAFVKGEVKLYNSQEDNVSIEIKDTNRPDLWSVEGLARALSGYLNPATKPKEYAVKESLVGVSVDSRLATIRPFMGVAIIKNLNLDDTIIRGLMHLQDKLDQTYGRNREKTSIGLYDSSLIVPPLRYTVVKPDEISFTPLGFSEEMTLSQILDRHPKGIEYGRIVKKHRVYPIILDSANKVLSFPPIINSNDLGRVTAETRDVLVEVTGTVHEAVLNALTLVTLALADRGGEVASAVLQYEGDGSRVVTPDFRDKLMELSVEYTNKILGLHLSGKQIAELLSIAGFRIEKTASNKVGVLVPCNRVDVMHPVDLVEDVAIAYGYNRISPVWRDLPTTGSVRPEQHLLDKTRELIVGLGFQEIMTNNLTNSETLFDKMDREKSKTIEVANPKVATMTCLRSWLLPSLMEFLSSNKSVEFPQKIFELGKVTLADEKKETRTRDENWVAAVSSHASASFTEIKSSLDSLLMNLGLTSRVEGIVHPSFIEGRVGEVVINEEKVGIIGEIHPRVLERWKLENPVSAFEINFDKIILVKKSE
jgi:phenylalanyl-tRNA synthetase beta chain